MSRPLDFMKGGRCPMTLYEAITVFLMVVGLIITAKKR